MASVIRIKRSSQAGNPSTLGTGELAYSNADYTSVQGGGKLYIGMGTETNGNAIEHVVIGGKYFTDMLDHSAGTLTAGSAIVVDSDSKIDILNVDNLTLNGNTISSTNTDGNITLTPNGDGYVVISGTNALVIPKGTDAQQAPGVSGAIRFNTTNTAFEGYDGSNWSSLGGVRSVDQLTYIKAEATPGAGDGTLYFNAKDGTSSTNVLTLDKTGLKILVDTEATGSNTGALQVAGGVSIEGTLYVQGNMQTTGGLSSDGYLAAEGVPNYGATGYGFINDNDTGMFSEGDGYVQFYSNNTLAATITPDAGAFILNSSTPLKFGNWAQIGQENGNTIYITPDTDNNDSSLRISDWYNSSNLNIWNAGNQGITLGNFDNNESYIDIGGRSGSTMNAADDITIRANNSGQVRIETNNNDISLSNDSGTMTFRNSDGHLVIPGVIETNDGTGDVTLAASDGTERNLVFKGDGRLSLPNNAIDFFDSNNISGNRVAELAFDGSDLYLNNFNGAFTVWANDTYGWTFNTDGSLSFPSYTFPQAGATTGQVLVDTAGNGVLNWTDGKVTIGTTDISIAGSSTTLAGLTDVTVGDLNLSTDTISYTGVATDGNIVIEPKGAGYISASNAQIKNVAEPTDDTDAATKYYVDAARSGLDVKQSVRLATTEDITLSGEQIIDTKMAVAGDRVLVKDQTLAKNNGIYVVVSGGAWTRATDFDAPEEVSSGVFTFVEDGSVNLNAGFVVTTKGAITIGTTAIDWTLFSASGTLIAGDGLSKSGYTLKVNVDSVGGIEINSDNLRLKSTVAGNGLTLTDGVLDIGGTADRITINSDSIDIASTYVGQTSITTLGTITSGTWNGDSIADAYIDNDLTISGGTIDDTPIGTTTRNSGKFTTLAANNLVTFTDTTDAGPLGTASVVLSGGLSVAKKIYTGSDLIGAGADTSNLSGFNIDGGTY